tara:strand:+ start:6416 stop:7000 length:585 start_codon:yes stop_codon:yes gene_type:complete
MGGYGSGRRSTRPKVEECSSIDANQLNRDGCFKNGWNGTMAWSRNGQKFSSIGMRATADYLHLGYSSEKYGSVIQPIQIERLPCRFGGSRAYFRCDCGKRVVKLYGFGRLFLCRHCCGLFHYSKNEGFWDRSLRQRTKHKRRLSGDASLEAYEMPKPKGMWWRTYYRLQEAAQAAENRAADDFITAARRLVKVG